MRIPPVAIVLGLAALSALPAGCGTPDNVVYGSVPSGSAAYPDAAIQTVRSAIHFNGTVTNLNPQAPGTTQRSIVILSGQDHLCDSLQKTPDYFKSAPQGFQALILMTPPSTDGDFVLQAAGGNTDASMLAAFAGQSVALLPGVQGDISVTEFNLSGNAKGTFGLAVAVQSSATLYPISGRFKTTACSAIQGAFIPRQR